MGSQRRKVVFKSRWCLSATLVWKDFLLKAGFLYFHHPNSRSIETRLCHLEKEEHQRTRWGFYFLCLYCEGSKGEGKSVWRRQSNCHLGSQSICKLGSKIEKALLYQPVCPLVKTEYASDNWDEHLNVKTSFIPPFFVLQFTRTFL